MSLTITIPDERAPGWNSTLRLHWAKRDELVQATWWRVFASLPSNAKLFDCPVDVHIVGVFKGRTLDSDNICAKLYIDAIKGRLISDDDPRYVRRVTTESRKGKRNSVTIQLSPVETNR